jgi:hypothetical protein
MLSYPAVAVAQFSFVTIATLGYGDITPVTSIEVCTDLVLMVVGTSLFGYVLASIAQLVTSGGNSLTSRAKHKLKEINAYLVRPHLTVQLRALRATVYRD